MESSINKLKGFGVDATTQSDIDYALRRRKYYVHVSGSGSADKNHCVYHATKDCILKRMEYIPAVAIAKDATDAIKFKGVYNDGAGGADTVLVTPTTTDDDGEAGYVETAFTADVAYVFTGISDADTVASGEYVFFKTVKVGAGKPYEGTVEIEVELA